MPAFIDENTQFVDEAGNPLVGGKAFFGPVNTNPFGNAIPIFIDRALTMAADNPQTLNSEGRTTVKIWVEGEYSLLVRDILDVQHLLQMDQGQIVAGGNFALGEVSGGNNNVEAKGTPKIISLTDKAFYVFEAIATNSAAMTLKVDDLAAIPIRQNVDQEIQPNKVQTDQTMVLVFNETPSPVFEWVNHSDKILHFTKTLEIASASTTNIFSAIGNYLHITGSNTINSFDSVTQEGSFRFLEFDANAILTPGANLIVPGNAPLITAPGDTCQVIADTLTMAKIVDYQRAAAVPFDGNKEVQWTFVTLSLSGSTVPVTLLSGLSNVNSIDITIKNWSHDVEADRLSPIFQLVTTSTVTSGYDSRISSFKFSPQAFNQVNNSSGFNIADQAQVDGGDQLAFEVSLKLFGNNVWNCTSIGRENSYNFWGSGQITLAEPLTGLVMEMIGTGGNNLVNGTVSMRYR